MLCLIRRNPKSQGCGAFPVAGRSLLRRQLQSLRAHGIEQIAVELHEDGSGEHARRMLADEPALARDARVVTGADEMSSRDMVEAAGIALPHHFLVIREATLMGFDPAWLFRMAIPGESVEGEVSSLSWWFDPLALTRVWLLSREDTEPVRSMVPGWALEITSAGAALRAGGAALDGRLLAEAVGASSAVVVHGAHWGAGVWVAKGAKIDPRAHVVGPVFVGPQAVVLEGASVGPFVDLGAGCLVEPGAKVRDAIVEPNTIIGEGLSVTGCVASPRGMRGLSGEGPFIDLRDPLLLGERRVVLP
ncbi:MAG: hypothetical protein KA712_15550 [Myxococcales bacterium]|nr:hypothetical protein [Myxococcales bacterium]